MFALAQEEFGRATAECAEERAAALQACSQPLALALDAQASTLGERRRLLEETLARTVRSRLTWQIRVTHVTTRWFQVRNSFSELQPSGGVNGARAHASQTALAELPSEEALVGQLATAEALRTELDVLVHAAQSLEPCACAEQLVGRPLSNTHLSGHS